jgi:hypothetical protein
MMEPHSPEWISTNDFLAINGVKEFGTATIFQGEFISPATERARLIEARADGKARRRIELLNFMFKDALAHAVGILLVVGLAVGSSLMLADSSALPQDREWARTMLSAIGGAIAGYIFGKGSHN